jgi:hypothetical protein
VNRRLPHKADVPDLEPPRGDPAHQYGEGVHLQHALLCGGRHRAAWGHAA